MVLASIVISRPSHSANDPLQALGDTPGMLISIAKLNAWNGWSAGVATSASLGDGQPIAALHQTDREKRHRNRRRHTKLDKESSLVLRLRRVQRRVGDHLKRRGRGRAGERAARVQLPEHFLEAALNHPPEGVV